MCRFLQFTVEEKLAGRADALKETLIGVHVFDRKPGYDPKIDAIVRVEARRLRSKLLEYSLAHPTESVFIELPKGSYTPEFRWVGLSKPEALASKPKRLSKAPRVLCSIATLAFAAALFAFVAQIPRHKVRPFYMALEGRVFTTYPGYQTGPSFSPDGEQVAFCWRGPGDGSDAVWVQPVHGDIPRRLTHARARESRPVWSPDGKQIAFLREVGTGYRSIQVINVTGTGERKIGEMTDNTAPGRIDWSPDGRYLVTSEMKASAGPSVIVRLTLATGWKQRITAPPRTIPGDTEPTFSPDGRMIAFRRSTGINVEDIYVVPTPSPSSELPLQDNELRRVTFDNRGIWGHTWSADGRALVVASCRAGSRHSLWRFPIYGGEPSRLTQPDDGSALLPAVSRAGNRLAYVKDFSDENIWQVALSPGAAARAVISSTMLDSSPQLSPDGNRIAFRSDRSGSNEIWIANVDGTNQRQVTHFGGPLTGSPRWSPDGAYLAFDSRQTGNADIYIIPANGGGARRFTADPASDVVPSWSRDGKSIYFASDRGGKWQVWKQDVAGGEAHQVTKGGGFLALESEDEQSLFYYRRDPEPSVWRIPVAGGQESFVVALGWDEMWGNWAVGARGLFFLDYHKFSDPPNAGIKFLDFGTGTVRQLGTTARKPTAWNTGLALSPDERWILFSQVDRAGSNIMLAENFR
jgi:Tol biopolymer transport system component